MYEPILKSWTVAKYGQCCQHEYTLGEKPEVYSSCDFQQKEACPLPQAKMQCYYGLSHSLLIKVTIGQYQTNIDQYLETEMPNIIPEGHFTMNTHA